jgi:anti-sigma regulatory factor (Ser/Thr protein kinase)
VARSSGPPAWQLATPGDPTSLRRSAAAVAAAAVDAGVSAGRCDQLALAVHELLLNAWEHGHLGAPEPRIRVAVARRDDGEVTVRVVDTARGGRWDPDVSAAPVDADRGRGLTIARALVDEVTVLAAEDRTVVTLTMCRGGAPA